MEIIFRFLSRAAFDDQSKENYRMHVHPALSTPSATTAVQTSAPTPTTVCATPTERPAGPATTATVAVPLQGVTTDITANQTAPKPAPIDPEAEAKLTSEILQLFVERKNANNAVRRTRAEMKVLRVALAEKLYRMKAILVGTGREGRWAPYLREQKLPVATANRYVAGHQAKNAQPVEKLLTEQHVGPTADDARRLAAKLLPTLSRTLVSQALVFEFIHELLWGLDVAEVTDTDDGLEISRTSREDSDDVEGQAAEMAVPAPAAA